MEANKGSLSSGPMEMVIFYLGVLGKQEKMQPGCDGQPTWHTTLCNKKHGS